VEQGIAIGNAVMKLVVEIIVALKAGNAFQM
jgi:hypothetical protein